MKVNVSASTILALCLVAPSIVISLAMIATYGTKAAFAPTPSQLLEFGANYAPYTFILNQYGRIISSGFVHRGLIHLALNVWAMVMVIPMLKTFADTSRCVLIFILSIVGGSLASMLWDPTLISCGASGGIYGLLGCYVSSLFVMKHFGLPEGNGLSRRMAVAIVAYCILLGMMTPGTDNANHLGGLIVGVMLGIWCVLPKILPAFPVAANGDLVICILLLVAFLSFEKLTIGAAPSLQNLMWEQRAAELASKHDYSGALRLLNSAIARNPKPVSLYANRIPILLELKMFREAIGDCDRVIAEKGNDVQALLSRSIAYHNLGEEENAISDLRSLLKIEPTRALAYNNIAWSEAALGQYEKALVDADKALSLDPNLATAHDTKAVILTRLNRADEAEIELDKAISAKGNDGAAFYHRAILLSKVGKEDEARVAREKSTQLGYKPEAWEESNSPQSGSAKN